MKFCVGASLLLTRAVLVQGFAPSSSFTSFQTSKSFERDAFRVVQCPRARSSTEMNMMFDQLSSAISEVAKNIGGRQR